MDNVEMDPALTKPFDRNEFTTLGESVQEANTKMEATRQRLLDLQEPVNRGEENSDFDQKAFDNLTVQYKIERDEWQDLKAQHDTMALKDPKLTIEKKETGGNAYALADQLLSAGSREEYVEMLSDSQYESLRGTGDSADGIPEHTLLIPRETTASRMERLSRMAVRSDTGGSQADAVQTDIWNDIISALDYFGGVQQVARKITTSSGNPLKYPRVDNSSQTASIVGTQATTISDLDTMDVGSAEVGAETITSGRIIVALEAIADPSFDTVGYVGGELVRRLGRFKNASFTTSVANRDFKGVASIAGPGVTAASADKIAIGEFVKLMYSVPKAYRDGMESPAGEGGLMDKLGGRIAFMFSDPVEELLVGLQDSEGRPLWNVSVREGMPNTLYGKPYVINTDLGDLATGNTTCLYGNFSHFLIRMVGGVNVQNFYDAFTAQSNSRHFMAFERCGSQHIGPESTAGQADAIKKLEQA